MATTDPALTPVQEEVLALLGATRDERPTFDAGLRHELRAELEEGLAPLADQVPDGQRLWLNKHALSQVHGCEARFLAERDIPFQWTPPIARGTVTHKAIEYLLSWRGQPAPLELVDEALARLELGGDGLAEWLAACPESERAELRSLANEHVAKFTELFPPIRRSWTPVTEAAVRLELCEGRIVLQGRIDLSLGRADGTTAGKVLIDFKTGGFNPAHLDDLRLYALVETLRVGTPPRLLASLYLDTGRPFCEVVTEGLLRAAARRTVDGAARVVELLHGGATPTAKTGPPCRWCVARPGCAPGSAWVAGDEDDRSGS